MADADLGAHGDAVLGGVGGRLGELSAGVGLLHLAFLFHLADRRPVVGQVGLDGHPDELGTFGSGQVNGGLQRPVGARRAIEGDHDTVEHGTIICPLMVGHNQP